MLLRAFLFSSLVVSLVASLPIRAAARGGGGKHEVFVEAPAKLSPGAASGLRVAVFRSTGVLKLEPADAQVEIALVGADRKSTAVWSGRTGKSGTVGANFAVPELADGDYTMEVRTKSADGDHLSQHPVKIRREHRILLVSDKPLYQPGQTMHLRALALGEATLRPSTGEVLFEVEDAKGNKVFKKRAGANEFGVASCDFVLADEVNLGDYRISATVGASKAEKAVTVKKYVLPKFKIAVKTDKTFYLPLETIRGTFQVDYFFGKPVKDANVRVVAQTFDVQFRQFADHSTKTDAEGRGTFEIRLPGYFVGSPLEKGNAYVQLEVAVTDTAEHEERATKSLSVANSVLQLHAVPESGRIVPGLENVIYVLATAPDGSPVVAEVAIRAGGVEARGATNETGFAALRMTPALKSLRPGRRGEAILDLAVSAHDRQGNKAEKTVELSSEYGRNQMLLRADKAIYRAGETVELEMNSTFDRGTVFLDAIRGGQVALASTCEIEAGRARYRMTLPPDLFGSLEIHAYKIMADGDIVRDTRVVYVHPPEELTVLMEGDKPQYRPAEDAKVTFRVTDRTGRPVQAALGVIIVDEAVYALQEMQPGLEKVYFTLAKELQEPKYGIKVGTTVPELIAASDTKRQEVAKILMAPAAPAAPRWNDNTYAARLRAFDNVLQSIYNAFYYYIVQDKEKFFVASGGKRTFKPDLLDELLKGKSYKLPKEHLVDPWGNRITLEDLSRLSSSFTFEHWAKLMSLQNLQKIWQALCTFVVEKDALVADGARFALIPTLLSDLGLPKDVTSDYFGEPYTPERLAREDEAFAPENVAVLTREVRRSALFTFLREYVGRKGGLSSDGKFTKEIQEAVASRAFARKPSGSRWTLEELGREHGAFAAENLARIANVERRAALYAALAAKVKKDGFDRLASFDKAWKWRDHMVEALVSDGLLTREQACDVGGRPFSMDEVAKEDPQFAPDRFLAALHHTARSRIDNAICNFYHSKNQLLPADPVGQLVTDGHVKREEILDAWGTPLKLVPVTANRSGSMGCGLLSGRFTILSAGPDRKFDTDDDVNVGAAASAGQYQPNYSNCVFYSQQGTIRGLSHGGSEHDEDPWGPRSRDGFASKYGGEPRFTADKSKADRKKLEEKENRSKDRNESGDDEASGGPIRVREYFPETLFWHPSLITDDRGVAVVPLKMADSITTWRVTASANSRSGHLGSSTDKLVVFQDFFVDIDLPVALTQNDSVSIPVAVYNYLKEDQAVTLQLESGDWFELQDEAKKEVRLKPDQVKAIYFKLKAKKIGTQALTVEARGGRGVGDAIQRSIEVVPDGRMFEAVVNDRLQKRIVREVRLPDKAIDDSYKIFVKIYPGVFSQMMEGVEGMLGMPHG